MPVARGSSRTKAERAMDELNAEAARLRHLKDPSKEDRARLIRVQVVELPKARRLVARLREAENQGQRYF